MQFGLRSHFDAGIWNEDENVGHELVEHFVFDTGHDIIALCGVFSNKGVKQFEFIF